MITKKESLNYALKPHHFNEYFTLMILGFYGNYLPISKGLRVCEKGKFHLEEAFYQTLLHVNQSALRTTACPLKTIEGFQYTQR